MTVNDVLATIGIDNYKSAELPDLHTISKQFYVFETKYIDSTEALYKVPNHDIYIYVFHKRYVYTFLYSDKYTYEAAHKVIIEKTKSNKSYYTYSSNRAQFLKLKSIENTNKLNKGINDIIDKVVNKVSKYDINVNIVLYGKPGSGKSSCVEIIAEKLGSNIYILPIDNNLLDAVKELPLHIKPVILIPELDKHIDRDDKEYKEYQQVLLELLNGCYSVKNSIIIITCNDYNKLKQDKIMTRPGRIHFSIEFPMISAESIKDIVLKYFPDHKNFSIFDKFINKVSIAEFKTAVMNAFITDTPIDETFCIAHIEYQVTDNHLYI